MHPVWASLRTWVLICSSQIKIKMCVVACVYNHSAETGECGDLLTSQSIWNDKLHVLWDTLSQKLRWTLPPREWKDFKGLKRWIDAEKQCFHLAEQIYTQMHSVVTVKEQVRQDFNIICGGPHELPSTLTWDATGNWYLLGQEGRSASLGCDPLKGYPCFSR